jgi:hypothetical protein
MAGAQPAFVARKFSRSCGFACPHGKQVILSAQPATWQGSHQTTIKTLSESEQPAFMASKSASELHAPSWQTDRLGQIEPKFRTHSWPPWQN